MSTQAQPPPAEEPRFSPDQAARAIHRAMTMQPPRVEAVGAADMTLEDLIAVGADLGLTESDVRAAAALERVAAPPPAKGLAGRVGGPRLVQADEIVATPSQDAAALLDEWVRVAHCMRVVRHSPDGTHWQPAGGIAGSLLRGARSIAGEPTMKGIREITTRVATVDEERSVVSVVVDPGSGKGALAGAGAGGAAIAVAVVATAVMWSPLLLVVLPFAAVPVVGVVIDRRQRIATAEREIQRLMSGVAHGEHPPTAMDAMRGRAGRTRPR